MLRRTFLRRLHHQSDPDNTPMHKYSPFGWHYLNPGGIDRPRLHNRNLGLLWHGHKAAADWTTVKIDISATMHPALQLALRPYLQELMAPSTDSANALKEYIRVAPRLPEGDRHALLAKVAEHCALKKSYATLKPVWERDGEPQYVLGGQRPSVALATAMLYAAAKSDAPEWKDLFRMSKRNEWNTAPHYAPTIWGAVLRCAGTLKDEAGVIEVLQEAMDCRAYVDAIPSEALVIAFNAITTAEPYEAMKAILFAMHTSAIVRLRHTYVDMRIKEAIPINDKAFYHVHWHFSIRKPMHFLPRRQYFDYTPSLSSSYSMSKDKAVDNKGLLQNRIAQWKEEGVLPKDYVDETVFKDNSAKNLERVKKFPWRVKGKVEGPERHQPGYGKEKKAGILALRRRFSAAPSTGATPTPPDTELPHTEESLLHPRRRASEDGVLNNIVPPREETCTLGPVTRSASSRWQRHSMVPTSLSNTFPCAVFLGGPVLLTAPHAKEVWRDGEHSAVKGICGKRLHKRELYTSEVVLLLSQSFFRCPPRIGASFVVWNVRALRGNLEEVAAQPDPNYLFEAEFETSLWHTALRAFRTRWGGLPLLHIDIHGKKDRKENLHIDIGLSALRHYNEECYARVRDMLGTQLGALFRSLPPSKSGKHFGVYFPELGERGCGFWGPSKKEDGCCCRTPHTMAHQASSMGIVGIQIELPRTLRTILVHSANLLDQWCAILQEVYLMLPNSCRTSRDTSLESHRRYNVPTISTCEYTAATAQLLVDVAMVGTYDTAKPI